METQRAYAPDDGSFLLELLSYAGWQLREREGRPVRIRALRDGVQIDVAGQTLSHAAGAPFARAMRSRRREAHGEKA